MLNIKFLLTLVFTLATCWGSDPIFDNVEPQLHTDLPGDYRLPLKVIPTTYWIKLEPHLDVPEEELQFTFNGESTISLKVNEAKNTITFHAHNLTINEAETKLVYTSQDSKTKKETIENVQVVKHDYDKDKDFVVLTLKDKLDATIDTYKLTLKYTGILNDKLRGFYRSSYLDENNNKVWLATTHFEPVGARLAFPCWDEPAIKAKFNIAIKHSADYHALSNMKQKVQNEVDDKTWTYFEETPAMSSYLVAFVVSDYESIENKDATFNVWTKSNAIESTRYALEHGKSVLSELETFTGIKYKTHGMTKMDQISIPDFSAGAMENWGLVTYRESALLYTDNMTSTISKQGIATVISHEFAHQWFGNLVSPKWWTYIWLNEGFANFFQFYITDKVINKQKSESSWRLAEQFVVKNLQASAFVTDASTKTRPMNYDAATPDQIKGLFDDIAYKKAGSVIRMMQHFLTDSVFTNGLRAYLNKYKFGSANSDDLFDTINTVVKEKLPSGQTLKTIMSNWVDKEGYPVITIKRNNETGDATITQTRFFLNKPEVEDKTKWWVPINFVTEKSPEIKDTKPTHWLQPTKSLKIGNLNVSQWVLFNKNQTGYYRVNYDKTNWERLANYLDSDKYQQISPVNRAQLIDDALNLARAGKLSYETALQITLYLSRETDYIPWYAAIRAFNYLDRVLHGTKNHTQYQKYVAQKLQNFINSVKYTETKGDTHITKLARNLAITAACKYGISDCKVFAEEKLEKWLEDAENHLPSDLKNEILCYGMRNADDKTWNMTLERYLSSNDANEKAILINGLGCSTSEQIMKTFLELTVQDDPAVGIFAVMNSIYEGNANSFDILMDFIQQNTKAIQTVDVTKQLLITYLNKLSNRITNVEQYGKLALFIERQQLLKTTKFNGLSTARHNLDWIDRNEENVNKFIAEHYTETTNNVKPPNSANSIALSSFLVIIPVLLARL